MGREDAREPADGSSPLDRPVDPHTRIASADARRERHLLRRVIAPVVLLLVSVPVVVVLVLNLRAVSDVTGGDSEPASAATSPSAAARTRSTESVTPTPAASEPRVQAVSATSGPVDGGQVLTVRGTDLDPVTQVLFGQLSGANLQHVSSSTIRVTTPFGAPGKVTLIFRAGSDDVPSAASGTFTYR